MWHVVKKFPTIFEKLRWSVLDFHTANKDAGITLPLIDRVDSVSLRLVNYIVVYSA